MQILSLKVALADPGIVPDMPSLPEILDLSLKSSIGNWKVRETIKNWDKGMWSNIF